MSYLNPSTAPNFVAGLMLLFVLVGFPCLIALGCRVARAYRDLKRANNDAAHLQALARYHAKLHESDSRN